MSFDRTYVTDLSIGRPHVVVLGAGASFASFPDGDKNGKKLPLMDDLIEVIGIDKVLGEEYKGCNIEEVFSELSKDPKNKEVLEKVQSMIFEYFEDLELPDTPTIYDHLLLSLREKDLIVTFNWDPFLYQAAQRNHGLAKLPKIAFLHGNVAIGFCKNCPKYGERGGRCDKCNKIYIDSTLLYPIGEKDYDKDPITSSSWAVLKRYLQDAYILTIFGYGAPASDYKAIEIFKEAWGPSAKRSLEQIEIIHRPDIPKDRREDITKPWDDLIHTHHYSCFGSIYSSELGVHPRRSCDALWSALMMCVPRADYPIPDNLDWPETISFIDPLVSEEG